MTNEKIIERLHVLAQLLPDRERAIFDYCRKHPNEKSPLPNLGEALADFLATVEHESKKQTAKNGGQLARFRAMERIIKSAKQTPRPALHGAWTVDGSQYVCDGYRLARLSAPLDLEGIPENTEPLDAGRLIDDASKNDGPALALPDPVELKAYIKTEKAKAGRNAQPPFWDFGDGLPRVNAQFLLDMIDIFPDATATASKHRPTLQAIYFESPDGSGILLPVHKK